MSEDRPARLSPQQRAQIEARIKQKYPAFGACPVCNERAFTMVDGVVGLPVDYPGSSSRRLGGQPSGIVAPSAGFVCDNCGHTLLFNLLTLGLPAIVYGDTPP